MITKSKNAGAVSTAGQSVKKGNKGRLELYAERTEDGLKLQFRDYGNYGRERWAATFPCDEADVVEMIESLGRLLNGDVETTIAAPPVITQPQSELADADEGGVEELASSRQVEFESAAEADEDEFVDDDDEELIEHLAAMDATEDDIEDIDQLTL